MDDFSEDQVISPISSSPPFYHSRQLFDFLIQRGFRFCKPRSSTWHSALIFWKNESALCVLFRKNGVDLRYFKECSNGILVDNNNTVSFSGGDLYRNNYLGAIRVHLYASKIATAFTNGTMEKYGFIDEDGNIKPITSSTFRFNRRPKHIKRTNSAA